MKIFEYLILIEILIIPIFCNSQIDTADGTVDGTADGTLDETADSTSSAKSGAKTNTHNLYDFDLKNLYFKKEKLIEIIELKLNKSVPIAIDEKSDEFDGGKDEQSGGGRKPNALSTLLLVLLNLNYPS